MRTIVLFYLLLLFQTASGQEVLSLTNTDYEVALKRSKAIKKPMLIYIGNRSEDYIKYVFTNDTLVNIIKNEYIPLFKISPKDKRTLKKQYDIKNASLLLVDSNEKLILQSKVENDAQLIKTLKPHAQNTYHYYTDEYKKEFIKTDSTSIHDAIRNLYNKTSSVNTRKMTMEYLKNQNSLLTPINYQLIKSMMPLENKELFSKFLGEMKPEMYTREMAEKVAFEFLLISDYSLEKTKTQLNKYNIPFEEEIELYLSVAVANTGKEKKDNCHEFVMRANTHDYTALASCFEYVLKYGNRKQIEQIENKYMFALNEGPINRSLLFADLLGSLYLSQGDRKTYNILKRRNENIRKKFLVKNPNN